MLRLVLAGSVFVGSVLTMPAGVGMALAGGEPGPAYRRPLLPPDIAYRDPTYVAPPPLRTVVLAPVLRAPRSLALPLYNEPPPRFPTP
ncbi:hypothetical protein [Methylobacterium sp. Leaf113]|uniref:hypothetical protein n=1 Tax=Methylobacterium sp. Leaf113 TaxID=1736259 RepID=UPI000B0933EB|nr:hypothetical protein [Methylobacterium sp. Leaf113]